MKKFFSIAAGLVLCSASFLMGQQTTAPQSQSQAMGRGYRMQQQQAAPAPAPAQK